MDQKVKDELINHALIANNQLSLVMCSGLSVEHKLKWYEKIIFNFTNNIIKMTEKNHSCNCGQNLRKDFYLHEYYTEKI